jgi:tetratricopeptide (TPR) repeat protein
MVDTAEAPVRVLISYAHDAEESAPGHVERVRQFWTFLRAHGIDARLDALAANRLQDWPAWMDEQLRAADFVLVVASPAYRERAEGRAPAGEGRGVRWEARLLRDILYRDGEAGLAQVAGVVLGDGSPEDLPDWLTPASRTWYAVPEFTVAGTEPLLRLLTGQDAELQPALGVVPDLPPRPAAAWAVDAAAHRARPRAGAPPVELGAPLRTEVRIRLTRGGGGGLVSEVSVGGAVVSVREAPLSLDAVSVWQGLRSGAQTAGDRLLRAGRALARDLFEPDAMHQIAGLIERVVPGGGVDVVVTGEAETTGVPIELTRLITAAGADLGPLVLAAGVTMRRVLADAPAPPSVALPGPFKVLAAVAAPDESPTGNTPLDVEAEMQAVLDAVQPVTDDDRAAVRILEVASLPQIREALRQDSYHVLHLSAHGSPTSIELADEDGNAVPVTTADLIGALVDAGRAVPLIVLSSCSGAAGTDAMAAGLVAHGADRVIAMHAPVTDTYATALTAGLYAELARDPAQPVALALARARRAAEDRPAEGRPGAERLPEYGVPLLLGGARDAALVDSSAAPEPLSRPTIRPGGASVRELKLGQLIGRRPELRNAMAALRRTPAARNAHGAIAGVQLIGVGGIGKTALAGRVVARLREDDGWSIAVHEGRWNPGALFAAVAAAVSSQPELGPLVEVLVTPDVPGEAKLVLVKQLLGQERLLVLFDDFEQNLTPGGTAFTDPGFEDAVTALTDHAVAGAVLVTSRYPLPGEDRALVPVRLPGLSPAELRRLFLRLPGLRDLSTEDRRLLTRIVGGHPRLIEFVDALLRGRRTDLGETQTKLRALANVHGISLAGARPMTEAIDDALIMGAADIFLDDLLALLTPEQHAALDQLAVCGAPVSIDDLAFALTGTEPPDPADITATAKATDALTDLTLAIPAAATSTGNADIHVHPWTAHLLTRRGHRTTELHERALNVRIRRFNQGRAGYPDLVDLPRQMIALTRHDEAVAAADQLSRILGNALAAAAYLAEIRDLLVKGTSAWLRATKSEYEMVRLSGNLDRANDLLLAADTEIRRRLNDGTSTDIQLQGDHSVVLVDLGDLATTRGQVDRAHNHYREALTHAIDMATTHSSDSRWQNRLSVCHERLGDLAVATGDGAAAAEHHQASLAIAERLAATDPTNTEWQRDLAVSHERLGDLAVATGDGAAAAEHHQASLAIRERLAATDSTNTEWQRDLSISHNKLGDLVAATGDGAAAAEHHQASLAIAERLAATDPTNTLWQRDLSISENKLGDLAVATGDGATAAERYQASLAIRERLAATDPTNTQWQRDLAVSHERLGDLAVATGDGAAAAEHHQASLAIRERLAATDPTITEWQRDLSISHNKLGDLAAATGDGAAAAEHYQAGLTIAERLTATDPTNTLWQRDLSISHERLGDLAAATGNGAAAAEHHQASLAIAERLAATDPTNEDWRQDLDRLREKVGGIVDLRETEIDVSSKDTTMLSRLRKRLRGGA